MEDVMGTATLRRTRTRATTYTPARRVTPHLAIWDDALSCTVCGIPQYARSSDRHITMDQLIERLLSEDVPDPMRLAANDHDREPLTDRPWIGESPPAVCAVSVPLPWFSDGD